MYLSVWSRPDITKATQEVARFGQNPGRSSAVKRIYRYLAGTKDLGLVYYGSGTGKLYLEGWVDADWAADVDDRKSTAAYVFTLNDTAVTWSCKLLPTTCLSSAESEYAALSRAGKECISARVTLTNLKQAQELPLRLNSDSQSAIALASSEKFHSRTRHIEVAQHFIRHLVKTGQIKLNYVSTEDNVSDVLTKALPKDRHHALSDKIGLKNITSLVLKGTKTKRTI